MRIIKQLALLFAVCVVGDVLSLCIGGFLPGNVLGLLLLLALLLGGRLREEHLRETATFFEENMPLFFLPACLGILELPAEVQVVLLPVLLVIVLTTVLTAVVTAATVKLVAGLDRQRKAGE